MHLSVVLAGGPMKPLRPGLTPAQVAGRQFDRPRSLLSLGQETVTERLIRQSLAVKFHPIVIIGKAGMVEWTQEFIDDFKRLPCELLEESDFLKPHMGVLRFALQYLLNNASRYDLREDTKVFIIFGDYVFSEDLFRQTANYAAPCVYTHKRRDDSIVLTGKTLLPFLKLSEEYSKERGYLDQLVIERRKNLIEFGFSYLGNPAHYPREFVEIDVLSQYELAKKLVRRESNE